MERTTGFEPATLTLAKAMEVIAKVMPTPASRPFSAGSSAQSAESARLRPSWFNALNLCELKQDAPVAEDGGNFEGTAELGDDRAEHVEGQADVTGFDLGDSRL